MSTDFFTQTAKKRAEAIAEMDAKTFAPLIRNHLVQLFRKAHAKDKGLTGMRAIMGSAFADGTFTEYEEGQEPFKREASDWEPRNRGQPGAADVLAFLQAVHDYDGLLYNGGANDLPYIDDITLADLETTRAKKGKVWGKHSPYRR